MTSPQSKKTLHVLLVEDSPSDAALFQENLASNGNHTSIVWTQSTADAVLKLKNDHFDVVLLDLSLPDSSGLNTVQKIRDASDDAPIVILTGIDNETVDTQAARMGVQDYLVKSSADGRTIIRAIRYAVERKHTEMALRDAHRAALNITEEALAARAQAEKLNVALQHEIAERKAAEEALLKARDELEDRVRERTAQLEQAVRNTAAERQQMFDVLETLPAYVCLLTPDYRMPFANRIFRQWFGYQANKRCHEFLFDRSEPCENCQTYDVLKTNTPHQWEWTGSNGSIYDVYDFPFKDTDGSTLILEMGVDITERKKAQAAVAAERQRFLDVLETLPVIVTLLRSDYRVEWVNAAYRKALGDNVGKLCYAGQFGYDKPCKECQAFLPLKTGQPHNWEWTMDDGRTFDIYNFPFTDVDGSPMILEMDIDVTEQRKARKALENLNQILEQRVDERTAELRARKEDLRKLNGSLEQRIAQRTQQVQQQADQLRALASQLSNAEQRERKRLSKILHDHIQQLIVAARMQLSWIKNADAPQRQAAIQAADSILSEALDASRSLAIDLSPPILHEAGLVGGLSWLAARLRDKNRFTVQLSADNDAEPAAEEIRFLLFECVRELLLNVIKHAGVSEARVTLARTPEGYIQLTVSDTGKGFDLNVLNNRRVDETTFGLFSIRQRLTHIGGQMEIETAPGRGARFTLTVEADPEASAPAVAADPASSRDEARTMSAQVCRVLICDDHKIMREGLVKLLQFESGVEVVGQAQTGQDAVVIAKKLSPDVVIMDINLDDMSGIDATRQIVAANPHTRVIGLSMHQDSMMASAMHNAGAVAYLTKTGPAEDLIAAVRACRS